MINESAHILNEIKTCINSYNKEAKIFLFGSRARGDYRVDSDWDIMILLNKPKIDFSEKRDLRKLLYKVELETGQSISAFVHTYIEWTDKQCDTPLFESVRQDGIAL